MERTALEGNETLLDQRGLGVDEARGLGAILQRALRYDVDVRLVVLADVGGVG